jgi:hypothetical protein
MNQHTKGPWSVGVAPEETLPTYLIGADGVLFCRVVGSPGHDAEANARLIAAAPDLLAACEGLVDLLGAHQWGEGPALRAARAAIAKAHSTEKG